MSVLPWPSPWPRQREEAWRAAGCCCCCCCYCCRRSGRGHAPRGHPALHVPGGAPSGACPPRCRWSSRPASRRAWSAACRRRRRWWPAAASARGAPLPAPTSGVVDLVIARARPQGQQLHSGRGCLGGWERHGGRGRTSVRADVLGVVPAPPRRAGREFLAVQWAGQRDEGGVVRKETQVEWLMPLSVRGHLRRAFKHLKLINHAC